jgi:hypothetical protein
VSWIVLEVVFTNYLLQMSVRFLSLWSCKLFSVECADASLLSLPENEHFLIDGGVANGGTLTDHFRYTL